MSPPELHRIHRVGWLRAAVLGANDGIVSTSSLIIGVAAAGSALPEIVLAGVAGLVAGALSMAAGEFVSVSSQWDTEQADLALEKQSLRDNLSYETDELATIYQDRGLDSELAKQVADQLMDHDALAAHARDELGISDQVRARPLQAALSSASAFTVGAALPLLTALFIPENYLIFAVAGFSLVFLFCLGGLAAKAGGAPMTIGALRVSFWGVLAMAVTAAVGSLFGIAVT